MSRGCFLREQNVSKLGFGTRMNKVTEAPKIAEAEADLLRVIGHNIRQLRNSKGMTLQALGTKIGLSPSMLSLLERGKTGPSIGTLVALASALGVQMSELLDVNGAVSQELVSRAKGQRVYRTAEGVLRRIVKYDRSRGVEIAINRYEPGTASAPTPITHEGYEYGLAIEGKLVVTVNGQSHTLEEGDLISYPSTDPHRIVNPGPAWARALWVNLKHA